MKLPSTVNHESLVMIYPVGLYRDIINYLVKDFKPRRFLRMFKESFLRKSYWNGFLCEPIKFPRHMTRCGKGFTQGMAFRDYNKMRLNDSKSTTSKE